MKPIKGSESIAPTAAVMTALASLACCLPWGIAAALGSLGISIFLERHRPWLIALSAIFLAYGAYSVFQKSRSCRQVRTGPTILLLLAAIAVFVVAIFPDSVAGFMIEYFR